MRRRQRDHSVQLLVTVNYTHTQTQQSAIVTMALSCTVFQLFDVAHYCDLEMWVRGHSRKVIQTGTI